MGKVYLPMGLAAVLCKNIASVQECRGNGQKPCDDATEALWRYTFGKHGWVEGQ